MLELPHVVVGATIATIIPNPLISLPLALVSHFITDYVPHWNPSIGTEKRKNGHVSQKTFWIIVFDCVAALLVGSWLASRFMPDTSRVITILFACFLAVAPDVVEAPHFFLGWRNPWIDKLLAFQKAHQWDLKLPWGIVTQVFVVLICFYFILSA